MECLPIMLSMMLGGLQVDFHATHGVDCHQLARVRTRMSASVFRCTVAMVAVPVMIAHAVLS